MEMDLIFEDKKDVQHLEVTNSQVHQVSTETENKPINSNSGSFTSCVVRNPISPKITGKISKRSWNCDPNKIASGSGQASPRKLRIDQNAFGSNPVNKARSDVKEILRLIAKEENKQKAAEPPKSVAIEAVVIDSSSDNDDDVFEIPMPPPPLVTIDSSDEENEIGHSSSKLKKIKPEGLRSPSSSVASAHFVGQIPPETVKKDISQNETQQSNESNIKKENCLATCSQTTTGRIEGTKTIKNERYKDIVLEKIPRRTGSVKPFNIVICPNCNFDHTAIDCKIPRYGIVCHSCIKKGHREPLCPKNICLHCGREVESRFKFCASCYIRAIVTCSICKTEGFVRHHYPDISRRYHSTLSANIGPVDSAIHTEGENSCSKNLHNPVSNAEKIKAYQNSYDIIKADPNSDNENGTLVYRPCDWLEFQNFSRRIEEVATFVKSPRYDELSKKKELALFACELGPWLKFIKKK